MNLLWQIHYRKDTFLNSLFVYFEYNLQRMGNGHRFAVWSMHVIQHQIALRPFEPRSDEWLPITSWDVTWPLVLS